MIVVGPVPPPGDYFTASEGLLGRRIRAGRRMAIPVNLTGSWKSEAGIRL